MALQKMGIGLLGSPNIVFKRKFRWTFQIIAGAEGGVDVPPDYVKVAARPNWTTEETEINYLNAKTWIPGKTTLETITVTYIDVAGAGAVGNQQLYNWLATVYNFTAPEQLNCASQAKDYAGTGVLVMYDGCGSPLESWELGNCWPTSVNFQDLDYSSSDNAEIELTLRYSTIAYHAMCPDFTPQGLCSVCQ